MKRAIQKWGNSLALRIPKEIALELGLSKGTEVVMVAEGEALVVTPVRSHPSNLEELVSGITQSNKHPHVETGSPRGREVW